MATQRIIQLTLFFIFFTKISFGQTNPPPMSMPNDSNTTLIDKIIQVTEHERYFVNYCSKKVNAFAKENNWTSDKTNEILGSVKFKYYNSTIYNSYASYSTNQLNVLLEALTLINKDSKKYLTLVLTNSMMQSNLDLFVKGVIEGKYVTSN